MGCVSQKQSQAQQQNKCRFQSSSFSNVHQNKKLNIESPYIPDNNTPILQCRSIDITKDEEFILKRDKKFIVSNQESPTTTPKFNQQNLVSLGQRKNFKVM
ncbi:unnamed protein product [Paramecium octaurelia]|uniref:Uncharacterized protein n=1 Tax=Paramecium octaurelia TaxID=43137 RepID=A0A8S1WJE7_PAROT|nr:unnamed protein product [Paramecium octaurelia]CAD8185926.1 unnamed protein product [Paramecium octaurelia]